MTDKDAVELLKSLIATPSLSRDESRAADIVENFINSCCGACKAQRAGNNIVVFPKYFDLAKPVVMLNSHIDTVKPAASYTFDPFTPFERDGKLYGLGSNDAGAPLVSLIAAFLNIKDKDLPYSPFLAVSAEEEVGGEGGMRHLLKFLENEGLTRIDMAIVGEPTSLQPAIAERGLLVLDCVTTGVTGHAARNEGINAIYRAIDDIAALRSCGFEKVSSVLGPIKISVTQIEAGRQHNVVPDECRWVADIRTTDAYSNEETAEMLQNSVSEHTSVTPRSTRVHASVISKTHPLVRAAVAMGKTPFVSPTTSDMSLMHGIPSLKIGPGESSRSHSADEFIYLSEIEQGIAAYMQLLDNLAKELKRQ